MTSEVQGVEFFLEVRGESTGDPSLLLREIAVSWSSEWWVGGRWPHPGGVGGALMAGVPGHHGHGLTPLSTPPPSEPLASGSR